MNVRCGTNKLGMVNLWQDEKGKIGTKNNGIHGLHADEWRIINLPPEDIGQQDCWQNSTVMTS